MANNIYYKLICIDETHAIIAEQQLNNSKTDKLKSKRLGRAIIVCINKCNTGKLKIYTFLWITFKIFTYCYGFTRHIKSETIKTA